jgi:calcineurin-like phosphoesterase family protein
MIDIFFTGDTHYNHRGLCRGESKWPDTAHCRDFDTLDEMNQRIIDNINAVVKPNDHLYHVGDVAFGHGEKPVIEFMERINCKNVWLFLGNHDYRIMSSTSKLRDMFMKVRERATLKINGQEIVMNHFPELIWNKHHHGSWHLHGHCHGSLADKGVLNDIFHSRKCMDIGIDTHPEFRPYHFDEIADVMSTREIIKLDHH